MSNIRLSVVMTNYNHSVFLKTRIRSILEQISCEDELVIADDASTDSSLTIINDFAQQDSRIRVIKNQKNLGVVKSINRAIEIAKGKYVTCLAADDYLLPGFVDKTMELLLKHPQIGICCSDCARVYEGFPDKAAGKIYTDQLLEKADSPLVFSPNEAIRLFWTTYFWIPGHTAIVEKNLVLEFGGFQEKLGPFCDWFLLHAIALNKGVGYIPEELSVWRQDQKSYSHQIGSDILLGKKFQMNIFRILRQKEFKSLRVLFRKSGILHHHIRQNLTELCLKPYYWDFLFSFVKRYVAFRLRKYPKLSTNTEK